MNYDGWCLKQVITKTSYEWKLFDLVMLNFRLGQESSNESKETESGSEELRSVIGMVNGPLLPSKWSHRSVVFLQRLF